MFNFTERVGQSLINIAERARTSIQKAPTYAMKLREGFQKILPTAEIFSGFAAMGLGLVGAVLLATHQAPELAVAPAIAAMLGGVYLTFDGISRASKNRGFTERTVSDLLSRRSFTAGTRRN